MFACRSAVRNIPADCGHAAFRQKRLFSALSKSCSPHSGAFRISTKGFLGSPPMYNLNEFDDVEPPLTVLVFRDEGLWAPHSLRKHRLRQPGRGSRADEHFEKASLPGRSEGLWHRRRREEKPPNFDPIMGLSYIRIFFWTSKASRATKGRATPPRQKGRSMTISRSLRFKRYSASSRSRPLVVS